jgi:hypothetical protein
MYTNKTMKKCTNQQPIAEHERRIIRRSGYKGFLPLMERSILGSFVSRQSNRRIHSIGSTTMVLGVVFSSSLFRYPPPTESAAAFVVITVESNGGAELRGVPISSVSSVPVLSSGHDGFRLPPPSQELLRPRETNLLIAASTAPAQRDHAQCCLLSEVNTCPPSLSPTAFRDVIALRRMMDADDDDDDGNSSSCYRCWAVRSRAGGSRFRSAR